LGAFAHSVGNLLRPNVIAEQVSDDVLGSSHALRRVPFAIDPASQHGPRTPSVAGVACLHRFAMCSTK